MILLTILTPVINLLVMERTQDVSPVNPYGVHVGLCV